jgi:hypothetical protein
MSCRELERYDKGELEEAEFRLHASTCSTCREALRLDKKVMSLAKASRKHVEAPQLWSRIEKTLQAELSEKSSVKKESQARKGIWINWFSNRRKLLWLVLASAVLIVCIASGIYFGLTNTPPDSGLLAQNTLAKVEQKETEYIKAIQELEKQAIPQMADMDLKLAFLYKDRLETIDAQIAMCREALDLNPANVHIRRYLMAALQDKKNTLAEVLDMSTEKSESRRST